MRERAAAPCEALGVRVAGPRCAARAEPHKSRSGTGSDPGAGAAGPGGVWSVPGGPWGSVRAEGAGFLRLVL